MARLDVSICKSSTVLSYYMMGTHILCVSSCNGLAEASGADDLALVLRL